ncbi:DHH family phosphoesterase, partial [Patescibacteria group bacterium]|nr:DHH family phosphoesterase [Patescibacteria group bacterium]
MKKWVIKGRYEAGRDIGKLLLENRGITEEKNEEFLSPPPISHYLKTLSPQFKRALRDAKALILQAIAAPQPVIIHGDYDADGICATAILYKTLIDVCGSQKTAYFIPNRFDHGYGLSLESVKEIGRLVSERFGASGGLIITTDCGITAEPKVIDRIKKMGFKLIITDHHHRGIGLPQADVLLWDDSMAGAGVAAVLAIALGLKDRQLLSLAGIATVTDLVPLRGFNRSLVKQSLETLTTNPPL